MSLLHSLGKREDPLSALNLSLQHKLSVDMRADLFHFFLKGKEYKGSVNPKEMNVE